MAGPPRQGGYHRDVTTVIDPQVWASLQALEAAGEPGFLHELVSEFVAAVPGRLAALRTAGESADVRELERRAHSFKGSCGALGALGMAQRCEELEQMGRNGACARHAEVLEALELEWQAVRRVLEGELSRRR